MRSDSTSPCCEYGAGLLRVGTSLTDFDVYIAPYKYANGTTFGAAGSAWTNGMYWRVRNARPDAPVGIKFATADEAGSYKTLDKIIVVSASEEIKIKRIKARDPHRSEEMIRDIIKNQMPDSEKLNRADFVIVNDESQLVIPQVIAIHQHLLSSLPKSY